MRVLLTGANAAQSDDGGGHTLSRDASQALMRRSATSPHRFFVFYEASASADWPEHVTRLPGTRSPNRHARDWRDRVSSAKRRLGLGQNAPDPNRRALRAQLSAHRLDCSLSFSPWTASDELPNIMPVWDLEHRRKPYFPEVAAAEWDAREHYFRTVVARAIALYTGTQTCREQIERFYGVDGQNIQVIAFPTPSFALAAAAAPRVHMPLPDRVSTEYLFYPAQYWAHKNHVRLLEALQILRHRRDWKPSLVCCGTDRGVLDYLRRRAQQLGVDAQTHFLGFISEAQLIALYQGALLMPFVSYFGPDNLPPLEANALGCPVIASAVDGAADALGEAAIYVNPDDASDLADAMWRIHTEEGLREDLVSRGIAQASYRTADNYADQLLNLLDALEVRFACFRE